MIKLNSSKSTIDYSRITLCPALEYKLFCQVCGKCEYCSMYKSKECNGCGANFKDESLNIKAKYDSE